MLAPASTLLPILLMCVGSICIGSSAVFVRLSDLGPLVTGFYRMFFSLPFLLVWMRWDKRKGVSPHELFQKGKIGIILAGVFFALDLALWNWSVHYTTLINASLFNNTAAFFIPLTLWLVFKEIPSLKEVIAAFIGFLGCTLLVGESFTLSYMNLLGDIVTLLSGIMVAFYLVALKQVRSRSSTGFLMFWTSVCATVILGGFVYLSGASFWPLSVRGFWSVLSQAILVQIFGQGLLAYSLGKVSATYAGIILFLAPLTSVFLGWLLYGEVLSSQNLFGMALIMVSIIAIRKTRPSS